MGSQRVGHKWATKQQNKSKVKTKSEIPVYRMNE